MHAWPQDGLNPKALNFETYAQRHLVITPEDAELSIRYGLDGVYVSNHGGRAEASGWGALESLPEVVEAVRKKTTLVTNLDLATGGLRSTVNRIGQDLDCSPGYGEVAGQQRAKLVCLSP